MVSRTQIQLNQPKSETPRSYTNVRQAIIRSTPFAGASYEPIIVRKPESAFVVQTTSFPDATEIPVFRKSRPWMTEMNPPLQRPVPLTPMASTGFQVLTMTNDDDSFTTPSPVTEQSREQSPLPIANNPIYQPMPPKKPPRTFQQEISHDRRSTFIDQTVPASSTTAEHSPNSDLGR